MTRTRKVDTPRVGRSRVGVTLVEVMVATVVGSIVLATLTRVVLQVGAAGDAIATSALEMGVRANETNVLRSLLLHAEARPQPSAVVDSAPLVRGLDGNRELLTFPSWCDVPGGWQEPCFVKIVTDGNVLDVRSSSGDSLSLRPRHTPVEFRFLITAADGGRWTDHWRDDVEMPIAVGLVSERDTTLLRIGGQSR